MASRCRKAGPQGPHFLGGLCAGGTIDGSRCVCSCMRANQPFCLVSAVDAADTRAARRPVFRHLLLLCKISRIPYRAKSGPHQRCAWAFQRAPSAPYPIGLCTPKGAGLYSARFGPDHYEMSFVLPQQAAEAANISLVEGFLSEPHDIDFPETFVAPSARDFIHMPKRGTSQGAGSISCPSGSRRRRVSLPFVDAAGRDVWAYVVWMGSNSVGGLVRGRAD